MAPLLPGISFRPFYPLTRIKKRANHQVNCCFQEINLDNTSK
uniref:Uncharacterized protein n=1 Tax=Klebsiella pneumoniae TaxID=573 RepID=U3PL71_KLEPN|nr:hypothetical protein [Klebsiella pneumoniae]